MVPKPFLKIFDARSRNAERPHRGDSDKAVGRRAPADREHVVRTTRFPILTRPKYKRAAT